MENRTLVFVHAGRCMNPYYRHPGSLNLHLVHGGCIWCHLAAWQVLPFTPSVIIVNKLSEHVSRNYSKVLHAMHVISLAANLVNPLDLDNSPKMKTNEGLVICLHRKRREKSVNIADLRPSIVPRKLFLVFMETCSNISTVAKCC